MKIHNYNLGNPKLTPCRFHTDWGIKNSRPAPTDSDTRASSNAVTLKLISRTPARRPAFRFQVRHANLPDRQFGRTGCVWKSPFIYIASDAGVGPGSGFAGVCASALTLSSLLYPFLTFMFFSPFFIKFFIPFIILFRSLPSPCPFSTSFSLKRVMFRYSFILHKTSFPLLLCDVPGSYIVPKKAIFRNIS